MKNMSDLPEYRGKNANTALKILKATVAEFLAIMQNWLNKDEIWHLP